MGIHAGDKFTVKMRSKRLSAEVDIGDVDTGEQAAGEKMHGGNATAVSEGKNAIGPAHCCDADGRRSAHGQ
ncbi:hypothetical protein [Comamonas sp. 17RB]|uniref:hypothetical protein n=1 Tax=Comamonas sp. 17RB TaxID=3047025 RepID=UPI0024B6A058|nr:hypothetical protein [Comamonas sp. 17RB]MDI9854722.1 hypothetical protein [Comamonas sp. 17RB]